MTADMRVYFDFGGSDASPGTEQDTSALTPVQIRFKTADDATIDSNNPIPIPTSGINYSYWKHIYLYCATAPSTKVDAVLFYTDGSDWVADATIVTNVGDFTPVKNSGSDAGYRIADGTAGTSGSVMTTHESIAASSNVYSYITGGSEKTCYISEASSQIDSIGETCDYLVFQMAVYSAASPGDLANETWTFQYDEV